MVVDDKSVAQEIYEYNRDPFVKAIQNKIKDIISNCSTPLAPGMGLPKKEQEWVDQYIKEVKQYRKWKHKLLFADEEVEDVHF